MLTMTGDRTEINYWALMLSIVGDVTPQKALSRMGLMAPVARPPLSDRTERDKEILRRHYAGDTASRIAYEMGLHRQTVYNTLGAAGIKLRKPKGYSKNTQEEMR